jgi:hypothetical protein
MQTPTSEARADDRLCPLTFVLPAGMIGGLIWLCMLLTRVTP